MPSIADRCTSNLQLPSVLSLARDGPIRSETSCKAHMRVLRDSRTCTLSNSSVSNLDLSLSNLERMTGSYPELDDGSTMLDTMFRILKPDVPITPSIAFPSKQGCIDRNCMRRSVYNTILERLLVWVQNPLGSFLSCSFFSYSIKPSHSELGSIHKLLAFDYKPYRSVGKGRVIG